MNLKKNLIFSICNCNFHILAASAKAIPPVGPTLSQHGINAQNFCSAFNEKTKNLYKELLIFVKVILYSDRTFKFMILKPSIFYICMMYLNKDLNQKITKLLIYKIWLVKYYNSKAYNRLYKKKNQIFIILSSIKTFNKNFFVNL
jgi:hypothetical protein